MQLIRGIQIISIALKAIAILWFITFVTEWHIRTEWKQNWLDGAIRAWSNFVMLEWFNTEIVAGLLAVCAASFVLISAHLDRKHRWHLELVRKQAEIFEDIERLQLHLRKLAHLVAVSGPQLAVEEETKSVEAKCFKLTSEVRQIAHLVMYSMARIREIQALKPTQELRQTRDHVFILLWATILSLELPDRFFELGSGRFVKSVYRVPEDDRKGRDFSAMTESDRARFRTWIDWES